MSGLSGHPRIRRLAALPAILAVGLSVLLPGCAATDPYRREGMWQPTGANAVNLAVMVDRPSDLLRGRGTRGFPAIEATVPVAAMWAGKPAPLPNNSSQQSPGGTNAPAAPAPSGGN